MSLGDTGGGEEWGAYEFPRRLALRPPRRRPRAPSYKVYAGIGLGFNNNYAGMEIGPDGTAYLGVTGGLIALRDR